MEPDELTNLAESWNEDTQQEEVLEGEDGEEVEAQEAAEVEATQAEPVAEDSPRVASRAAFTPPAPNLTAFTPEDRAKLNDALLTSADPASIIEAIVERRLQQYESIQATTNHFVHTDQAKHPEWYREHGASVQRMLATMQPQVRTTEYGLKAARAMVILEQIQNGGDEVEVLAEHLAKLQGGKKSPITASAPPRVLTPQERVPSGGGGSGAQSAATRKAAANGPKSAVEDFMKGLGLSDSVIRALSTEEGITRR